MSLKSEPARPRLRQAPNARRPMFHRIFRADAMAVREALIFVHERLQDCTCEDAIGRLELALAEVLNNICQHGTNHEAERLDGRVHSPLIHLCVVRHVGGIACAITDDGQPLPPHCLTPRNDAVSVPSADQNEAILRLPEGGFGWQLIREITASLSYLREGRRNFLAFIVPVNDMQKDGQSGWFDMESKA